MLHAHKGAICASRWGKGIQPDAPTGASAPKADRLWARGAAHVACRAQPRPQAAPAAVSGWGRSPPAKQSAATCFSGRSSRASPAAAGPNARGEALAQDGSPSRVAVQPAKAGGRALRGRAWQGGTAERASSPLRMPVRPSGARRARGFGADHRAGGLATGVRTRYPDMSLYQSKRELV
jgi:hypothetical protein